jgi:ribonuclease P protein component
MLSRKHRFHGHGSVRRVYRLGRPSRTTLASLHVHRGDKVQTTKVAVVVSRKVDKSAVRRNRIRRRIYEYIRTQQGGINPPAELVVTVYQTDAAQLPSEELQKSLDQLFKKAKL